MEKERQRDHRTIIRRNLPEGATYVVKNGKLELMSSPLAISPGLYRSRDGHKIRVYEVNKNFPSMPALGAIEIDGVWHSRSWNVTGKVHPIYFRKGYVGESRRPYGPGNDIIDVWSET